MNQSRRALLVGAAGAGTAIVMPPKLAAADGAGHPFAWGRISAEGRLGGSRVPRVVGGPRIVDRAGNHHLLGLRALVPHRVALLLGHAAAV